MAPRRHLQRQHRQGGRELCEEGLDGLYRGRPADPQMDRPAGRREVHDRDRGQPDRKSVV